MKHLVSLSLLFYLASCVQGEQKVPVSQGATVGIIQPSQNSAPGYPSPSPIPPEIAFAPTPYPFSFSTAPITLKVNISNPNNLPYSIQWLQNGITPPISNPSTTTTFIIYPSQYIIGTNSVSSVLKDSSGQVLSILVWSFEISSATANYSSLSPLPAPTPYPNLPIPNWGASQNINVSITNSGGITYSHIWFLDGAVSGTPTTQTAASNQTFIINPAALSLGNHTIVSQIKSTPDPATNAGVVFNSATWIITIANVPQFSSFVNPQLPAPANFPDIQFASNTTVLLDPNLLSNPQNATFTIYWIVDGATETTATFSNPGGSNFDPPAFTISATDTVMWPPGNHSVQALLYDTTNTLVDDAFWAFEILYPPPTTITDAVPSSGTFVSAVTTIPLNASLTGFFGGPPTNSSRGTFPITIPSANDFCVTVGDGRGVGFVSFPSIAGVQIQFKQGTNGVGATDLTPALEYQQMDLPPAICLDGQGSKTGAGSGNPNFTIGLPAGSIYYLTANVIDILSLQTVGFVNWEINVVAPNTQPTITKSITPVSVTQNASSTFAFTVQDQDGSTLTNFSSGFTFSSPLALNIPLDGTTTYYGNGNPPNTPNCWREYSYSGVDKFSCTITIPAANGNIPAPAAGTFTVSANVNNLSIYPDVNPPVESSPTDLYNPAVPSLAPAIWSFSVIESNVGTPTLQNINSVGGPASIDQTFMFSSASTPTTPVLTVSTTASETEYIGFNLVVDDLEKDNFTVKLLHNSAAAPGTFTEYFASSLTTPFTIIQSSPPNSLTVSTIPAFYLEENVVTGAAGATITFMVVLTDVPEMPTTIANTSTTTFQVYVNNYNPPPSIASATFDPVLTATATVMQGFPYTLNINEITDASISDGNELLWQWMILDVGDCASTTATPYVSGWKSITGATQPPASVLAPSQATLTWSSPSNLDLSSTCPVQFRNCIGDNGFGNPIDTTATPCLTTEAGPWVGPIYGVGADQYYAGPYAAVKDAATAMWADPTNPGMVYGVHVTENAITLGSYFYNADTSVVSSFVSFPTDASGTISYPATSTEGAYDLSITGNNNNIFVSYVFNRVSTTPPYVGIPTSTVVRIPKVNISATSTVDYFVNDDVVSGVGQVVANDSAFWLPYINSSTGNIVSVLYGDGQAAPPPASPTKASLGLAASSIDLQSRTDYQNNLYLASKLPDGTVNLYQFNLPSAVTPPVKVTENLDIFGLNYVPFTEMTMAVGASGTNDFIYIAGINTLSKTIFYNRQKLNDLSDDGFFALTATATYPEAYDDLGINAVPSLVSEELLVGVIKHDNSDTNAYLLKINGNVVKESTRINRAPIPLPSNMIDSGDFAITEIIPQFTIGTAGAVPLENTKNTLWFRYNDDSTERNVIVNTEDEKFSNSAVPAENVLWGQPWFRAP